MLDFEKTRHNLLYMSIGATENAQVDQLLLDLGRGVDIDALVQMYGEDTWNQAIGCAVEKYGLGETQVEVPEDILTCALTHEDTSAKNRARGLVQKIWKASLQDVPVKTLVSSEVLDFKARGVKFDTPEDEQAWAELGQTYSQKARELHHESLGWTRVDAADHLLAALEPYVGDAQALRKWACSSDCALPNTQLAFRRGQLRITAAKARGQA